MAWRVTNSRATLKFDANVADDQVECWGISVPLPKTSLFAEDREERRRTVERKVNQAIEEFFPILEERVGRIKEIAVSLASAWTRYYVFRLDVSGDKQETFALNVLAPNSPLDSFDKVIAEIRDVCRLFAGNVAKPLAAKGDYMIQEWVNGVPLSEFREGDVLVDINNARKCTPRTSELLYRLNKVGYIYHPWDDYEVAMCDGDIVFLDVTRFERRKLRPEDFFDFYFGAPFTPPEIIKPSDNPAHRLYWRGVSEKDYFGTSKQEYIELFLLGVAMACDSFEEFIRVCRNFRVNPEKTWWRAEELKVKKS